ncbi:MAG: lipid II:glycine glycyltransferase FemX [Blastococcus sp.]
MAPPSSTTLVEVTTPAPRDTWEAIAARNPSTLPSQTPVWLDAVCALGPWVDDSRLYATGDGRALVLPMVRRRGLPRNLPVAHSMPSTWGSGGLVATDPVRAEDVAAVVADLRAGPALRTTVRPDFEQSPLWTQAARAAGAEELPSVHHVLDLDGDFDQIAAGFSKMARKAIRKAVKEHVSVEECYGAQAVLEFYRLYLGWIDHRARRRGLPLFVARRMGRANEPLARLLTLSEALGKAFTVWIARLDGRVIAAMITLVQGDVALAWRAASDREVAGPVRANDLLHRHAIEFAALRGCRYYDMGESGGVESLMRFKIRFGATPRTFAGYRFDRLPVNAITGPAATLRRRGEHAALEAATRLLGRKGAAAGAPADN